MGGGTTSYCLRYPVGELVGAVEPVVVGEPVPLGDAEPDGLGDAEPLGELEPLGVADCEPGGIPVIGPPLGETNHHRAPNWLRPWPLVSPVCWSCANRYSGWPL